MQLGDHANNVLNKARLHGHTGARGPLSPFIGRDNPVADSAAQRGAAVPPRYQACIRSDLLSSRMPRFATLEACEALPRQNWASRLSSRVVF
jgi:hypothetical protein